MRLHFGEFTLDEDRREVLRGEDPVRLAPKAFRLLQLLASRYPRTVSKAEIFDIVWPDTFVAESNLPIVVKDLRLALGDDARQPHIVRTVFAHGYALATAVIREEAEARPAITSIAVLPLANCAGTDWDYAAEGISEGIINGLARLNSLRVVPRSTSFRPGSKGEAPAHAGQRLRVDCVFSGRLRVVGDELIVLTELIYVPTEALIWGESFRRQTVNFADLQAEIVAEVAPRLRSEVYPEVRAVPTANGEAYRLYLLGRHYWSRRDSRSFGRALESFAAAAALDPSFALAHAATAETYAALGTRETIPPREVFPLARNAAVRAVQLDPRLSAAYTALAAVEELFDWDWAAAERSHQRAIEMDPFYATAAQWFALHLARRGRHEDAQRWIAKALLLEPASTIINTNAALIAYLARDFDGAVRAGRSAVELDPEFESARLILAVAQIQVDPEGAILELQKLADRSQRAPHIIANLASAFSACGQVSEARAVREEIDRQSERAYVSAAHRALAAMACEDHERAVDHAEAAAQARSPWLSYLRTEVRFDALRADPRIRAIEAEIGF
ncbi:MAG: winged helix-turn-helix domain-containing protein [Thermoanaerobaculia bacterium]|nr:winged helix-turn-helix domain-containing protein [Thermoanaerobaculia bacterium]